MSRALVIVCIVLALPFRVPASEFDWLVREFSRESGTKPIHIPFFGLARFAIAVGHPAGVSNLRMAVFENVALQSGKFSQVTDKAVGPSWKPMIRVRSRNGESTNIYLQSVGKELHLLLAVLDGNDATLLELRVRPETLMKFVDEHASHSRDQEASLGP